MNIVDQVMTLLCALNDGISFDMCTCASVLLYDESFSTKDALEKLENIGATCKMKNLEDQIAATIILEEVIRQLR